MKFRRQNKILELIRNNEIETQEELNDLLGAAGFTVTQATVSRDIRELNITKVSTQDGRQKYAVMASANPKMSDRLVRVFRDGVISMECAQNILVIKTLEGMAMAVAASIDAMENAEVVGTIAGDNTIFCVTKNEARCVKLLNKFKDVVDGE